MDKTHQSTICSESSDISLSGSRKTDEKTSLQDRVGNLRDKTRGLIDVKKKFLFDF